METKSTSANHGGVYQLRDFLRLHDKQFLNAAFIALMKRDPDPGEESRYLRNLRNGVSRQRILQQLTDTDEFYRTSVRIYGLRRAMIIERLRSIPVLGALMICLQALCSGRRYLKRLRALENGIHRIEADLECSRKTLAAYQHIFEDLGKRRDQLTPRENDLENLVFSVPFTLRSISRDIQEIKRVLGEAPETGKTARKVNGV